MLHPDPDPNQPNVYSFLSIYLYTCLSIYLSIWGFPGSSVVKNLLAMQEMQVQSLGREDALENE